MTTAEDLASFAALLADRTRASICLALLDGRAWTAGELAVHAGVARSTATEHLHRLISGGLLVEARQGRHRYVRLAGPFVAELLEELVGALPMARGGPRPAALAGAENRPVEARPERGGRATVTGAGTGLERARRSAVTATRTGLERGHRTAVTAAGTGSGRGLRAVTAAEALRRGRTCYDHLAGRLGIAVTDAMAGRGLLDRDGGLALTTAGRAWFADELGLSAYAGGRAQTRECLDWTERRPHLAGAAGARLCETFFARGWLVRIGSGRAVRLTRDGKAAVNGLLGLSDVD
jgi:DNA-binding transcriptional ArsR family regulator